MSSRSILLAAAALAAFVVAAPFTAQAQFFGPPAVYVPAPWEPEPLCQPLCEADYAPCDPPYFKHADHRCQTNHRGRHR